MSILATKLFIPPPRLQMISRPRLNQKLNAALSCRLTLISASAGFGKTTIVSEWVANINRCVAWLSLDEGDNDTTRFLNYLIAAFQSAIPDFGKNILLELRSPQPPPIESMLTSLLNNFIQINKPLLLVLDDYHLIDTKEIDELLSFLIENMPPQLHLLILTREDPNNFPLPRLRAQGLLAEIRSEDLRFTTVETNEFFKRILGFNLAGEDISTLETRTEGWIAGLQLASLAMKGRKDLPEFIKSFTGSHHFVLDYLLKEVLQEQTERVRGFLLYTSILDRLSGPLCDAVLLDPGISGQNILESIEQGNLFLIPLDNERLWYRYHHLFADMLQTYLIKDQPELLPVLHLRASQWFEKNGQRSKAICHALAAKDYQYAAKLIELAWPEADRFTHSRVWLNFAKALPDKLLRTRPILMFNFAQALFFSGKFEEGEHWLRQVEALFDIKSDVGKTLVLPPDMEVVDERQFQELPSGILFAHAYQATSCGDMAAAIKYAALVLELALEDDHAKRLSAMSIKAFSYWAMGELEAAYAAFSDAMTKARSLGRFSDAISGTFILADIRIFQGRLTDAANLYESTLQLLPKPEHSPHSLAFLYLGLSNLHREWGYSELAQQYLQKSLQATKKAPLQLCQYRIALEQASERANLSDLDGALEQLNKAEQLYYRNIVPEFQTVCALKTRVWIKQNRLDGALAWVRRQKLSVEDELSFALEFNHITLARLLIAQYRNDKQESILNQALSFLERLNDAAKIGNRLGRLIEILILQSLVYQLGRDIKTALKFLQQALNLAEVEGYVQIFVTEGKPLELLLNEVEAKRITSDYAKKLLLVYKKNKENNKNTTTSLNDVLVEPLSKRELEVLKLIEQGLSNQDISKKLFITLSSVKGHNQKIFAKLQVKRRTEAVARARELSLV